MLNYFLFYKLNRAIYSHTSKIDRDKIAEAFLFGADAHETQIRSSGEPYFSHPVAVACVLAGMKLDTETIIAALLHDVVEDTERTSLDIEELFGKKVAELVDGVTKLTQISFNSKAEQQAENFRKMMLAMVEDIRVILIKLADRLHNMTTLAPLKPEKRRRVSYETLEIFAPIAHRLGMHHFKNSFEELAFEGIYPNRYRILKEQVRQAEKHRHKFFEKILQRLTRQLDGVVESEAITGRQKRLYSIYRKMRKKDMSFSEIMDMYAYKVIAPTRRDCYLVMGVIHEVFRPIPSKFKDYIATPKANGYQSLHTIVFGPYGVPIEVQIKTKMMDDMAERGVAAHWLYKSDDSITNNQAQKWLKKLSDLQAQTDCSVDFIESVKVDLFPDEVYVFTPNGEIIELPQNATCVDFAYHIHTDVGNRCIAAKVNRRTVPLSYRLKHGDTVEIVTSSIANPNKDWLNFVTTNKATHCIRTAIKRQENNQHYQLGMQMVENALKAYALELKDLPESTVDAALVHYDGITTINAFLIEAGLAMINIDNFIKTVIDSYNNIPEKQTFLDQAMVNIEYGDDPRISGCCLPLPGDQIVGVVVPESGLQVHRSSCRNAKKLIETDTDRVIKVNLKPAEMAKFKTKLCISLNNRQGAIADVTAEMSRQDVDIHSFNILEIDNDYGLIEVTVLVRDHDHAYHAIRAIRRMSICLEVERRLN